MIKRLPLIIGFLFLLQLSVFSQTPVNAYAKITAIAGTSVSVNNVNQAFASFTSGQYVIVMQMQDNVIGANTSNNASFGNLSAIQAVGKYEVAQIASITGSPTPTSITLTAALTNTYNISVNSSVQLISYPTLGSPNYTTTSTISAVPWNGNVGGVVAFLVNGALTLNHNITVDGAGFRGGSKNTPNGYTGCDATTYVTGIATRYAGKGEGIYLNTNAAFNGARGRMLNGGGGGNDVNAGGGGGGNYSVGGDGGNGWVPAGTGCSPGVGGLGGISLSGQISGGCVFMGGGGGGGHENDGLGSAGGNGGGIILIRANSLVVSGSCTRSISANGITPANAANDGSGGAGGGGSIVLNIASYTIAGTCPLAISANGGKGGNSVTSGAHGGGGGGGQGAVIFSGAQPGPNITTQTNAGTGGSSCSGCTVENGVPGGGPNNTGIFVNTNNPLPVELINFTAQLNGNRVDVTWQTASEINNDYFIVERAADSQTQTELGTVDGNGTSTQMHSYSFPDLAPNPGMNYYRLRQVDFNGSIYYSDWVAVEFMPSATYVSIFPNPSEGTVNVQFSGYEDELISVSVIDVTGRIIEKKQLNISTHEQLLNIDITKQPAGIYFISINSGFTNNVHRVVKY
ncbi:MAG: T9SS type A sorting domain-containing protein [Bacteroidia bacterium]